MVVLAPADGIVVSAVDGGRDNRPQVEIENRRNRADRAELFGRARGLPITFRDYGADGRRVARGTPVQGQFIRP